MSCSTPKLIIFLFKKLISLPKEFGADALAGNQLIELALSVMPAKSEEQEAFKPFTLAFLSLLMLAASTLQVSAQLTPDHSLGAENSVVSAPVTLQGIPTMIVNGGATRGTNLFHSFTQFSIPTGTGAAFNHAITIQNIITRITGSSPSNIDGLLATSGKANLILVNPNGINFGPKAFLSINGSFLASTARSVLFADGSRFDATPAVQPLLSVSVPVGLGFGEAPQPITVASRSPLNLGIPTALPPDNPQATPSNQRLLAFVGTLYNQNIGIQAAPGKTLALIGGDIALSGGNASAIGGNVELGTVGSRSVVGIVPTSSGWTFDYNRATRAGTVALTKGASINVSGPGGGSIRVQTKQLTLAEQSTLFSGTLFDANGSDLTLSADAIDVRDGSVIATNTFGAGRGAALRVEAENLTLDHSLLFSTTFGNGDAGPIQIALSKDLSVSGALDLAPRGVLGSLPGGITTLSGYTNGGNGGLDLQARNIRVSDQAFLSDSTLGNKDGQPLRVKATNLIELIGSTPLRLAGETEIFGGDLQVGIFTDSYSAARAGDALIEAQTLRLLNGAAIDVSALTTGSSGNLTVKASKNIDLVGQTGTFRSGLYAGTVGMGRGGSLVVETPHLFIDRGLVSVASAVLDLMPEGRFEPTLAFGNAGMLSIRSRDIRLQNGAEIRADAGAGQFGNVKIDTNRLILSNGSKISANAFTTAGGNVALNADVIALLSGSQISANSQDANGGNVRINAQGIFLSSDSSITATSRVGPQFAGVVQINTLDVDLSRSEILAVPDAEIPQVASTCGGNTARVNSFTISGTGGVPTNPDDFLTSLDGWHESTLPQQITGETADEEAQPMLEAQGWERTAANTVRFVIAGKGIADHADSPAGCVRAAQVGGQRP